MARIRNGNTDLVSGPIARAREQYIEQTDRLREALAPQKRLRPTTEWLHQRGINLKDISLE